MDAPANPTYVTERRAERVHGDLVPRYFFHVRNGLGETEDLEGCECPDLEAARDKAVEGARSLICDEVRQGRLDLTGTVTVTDASGRTVLVLRYDEAVTEFR